MRSKIKRIKAEMKGQKRVGSRQSPEGIKKAFPVMERLFGVVKM